MTGTAGITATARRGRTASTAALLFATTVGLTGCTFSASVNRTVAPSSFETVVADALEKSVGQRPQVDCGPEPIDLRTGNTVHCEIGAEGDPTKYDSTVEVTRVDGSDYSVHVEVAETPE